MSSQRTLEGAFSACQEETIKQCQWLRLRSIEDAGISTARNIAVRLLAAEAKSVRFALKKRARLFSGVSFSLVSKASGFGRRCRLSSLSVESGILATASNDDRAGPQSNCDRSSSRSSFDVRS